MKAFLTRIATLATHAPQLARRLSSPSRIAHDGEGITIGISLTLLEGNAISRMIGMFKALYPKITMKVLPFYRTGNEQESTSARGVIESGAASVKDIDGLIVPGSNHSGNIEAFSRNPRADRDLLHLHVLSQIHAVNQKNGAPIFASCAGNYYLGIYVGGKMTDDFNWFNHNINDRHAIYMKKNSWLQKQAATYLSTPAKAITDSQLTVLSVHKYIIDDKTLPSSCIVQATARDGSPAVISYGAHAIGFQDHFESPLYPLSTIIPQAFVQAIMKNRARSAPPPESWKMPVSLEIKHILERTGETWADTVKTTAPEANAASRG